MRMLCSLLICVEGSVGMLMRCCFCISCMQIEYKALTRSPACFLVVGKPVSVLRLPIHVLWQGFSNLICYVHTYIYVQSGTNLFFTVCVRTYICIRTYVCVCVCACVPAYFIQCTGVWKNNIGKETLFCMAQSDDRW